MTPTWRSWPDHDLGMKWSPKGGIGGLFNKLYYRKLLFHKVHILTVHYERIHVAKIDQDWASGKSCTETPNDPLNCPWVKMCIRSIVALWNRFWMNFRFVPWTSLLSLRNNRFTCCSINIPAPGASDTTLNRYKLSKVIVIIKLLSLVNKLPVVAYHTTNSSVV